MNELTNARKDLGKKTLDELADWMAEYGGNTVGVAQAEFLRRQTQAALDTAEFTKKNARYMLWSVIVLSASAFIQMLVVVIHSL